MSESLTPGPSPTAVGEGRVTDMPEPDPAGLARLQIARLLVEGSRHMNLPELGLFGHVVTAATVFELALETAFRHPQWARYWMEQWRLPSADHEVIADELVRRFPVPLAPVPSPAAASEGSHSEVGDGD